jgi:hypothetical protein
MPASSSSSSHEVKSTRSFVIHRDTQVSTLRIRNFLNHLSHHAGRVSYVHEIFMTGSPRFIEGLLCRRKYYAPDPLRQQLPCPAWRHRTRHSTKGHAYTHHPFSKQRGFNAYGSREWSMRFRCIQKVARCTRATLPARVRDSVSDGVYLDASVPWIKIGFNSITPGHQPYPRHTNTFIEISSTKQK